MAGRAVCRSGRGVLPDESVAMKKYGVWRCVGEGAPAARVCGPRRVVPVTKYGLTDETVNGPGVPW